MPFADKALFTAAIAVILALTATAASAQGPFNDFGPHNDETHIDLPGLTEYAPFSRDAGKTSDFRSLRVEARLTKTGKPLRHGLVWRVFSPVPGPDGKLSLLATSRGGSAAFQLRPGVYLVNVAFGRASATRKVRLTRDAPSARQAFSLNAGGMILKAVTGHDIGIPADKLTFSVYTTQKEAKTGHDKRRLVMSKIKPDTIVRLKAGTYHIVSDYGTVNAITGADIRVSAGKLTEATIQHRAAQLTLKLVSKPGGEAIADTAWSILTPAGDVVSESVGAFPSLVLTEGRYTAVARNKGRIYQRDFSVKPGRDKDVEVLLRQQASSSAESPRPH